MKAPQRVNVLGVGVSAIDIPLALETLVSWIAQRDPHYVCVTGVHGIMESQRDERLRQIHNRAGLVTPDGVPLVWISHIQGYRSVRRVYGPDLMLAFCKRSAANGYGHFLYGGGEGVATKLTHNLQQRFPGLRIVGSYTPPFRELTEKEDTELVQLIN